MHTAVASTNREQLGSSVFAKQTVLAKQNGAGATRLCIQNTSQARTWKAFTTSRILAPCVTDSAADLADMVVPGIGVEHATEAQKSDRPLWSAWPIYHGPCELKKPHLRNFRFDDEHQQLTFDIGSNVTIDTDEFLILASSPRLRLLGNTTPSKQRSPGELLEASLEFPSGGPYFVEVYWMQSGTVGAVEPPSSAKTLTALRETTGSDLLRCAPQMPVGAFFFDIPETDSIAAPLAVEQLRACWDVKRERHSPQTAAVAKWEGSDFQPAMWNERIEAAQDHAVGAGCSPPLDGRGSKSHPQSEGLGDRVAEQLECDPKPPHSCTERETCAYRRRSESHPLGPFILPGRWVSGIQGGGAGLCAYHQFDAATARKWVQDNGISKITILGDSHASHLRLAALVMLEVPIFCIAINRLHYGTQPDKTDALESENVSHWETCAGFMTSAGQSAVVHMLKQGPSAAGSDRSIAVFAFGTWVAAYRTLALWTKVTTAMRKGLIDCRDNHQWIWEKHVMIIWTETKYRFEPGSYYATAWRIQVRASPTI
jgi:hypothetical protein